MFFGKKIFDVYNKYPSKLKESNGLIQNTKKLFSLEKSHEVMSQRYFDKYVKVVQES